MSYDDTNRGALFAEENKKQENSPDYTGKLNVNGLDYRLAGWKKQGKNGKIFLSLSISEVKYEKKDQVFEPADNDEPINLADIPF